MVPGARLEPSGARTSNRRDMDMDERRETIVEKTRRWARMSDELGISASKIAASELNAEGDDDIERERTVYCYIASEIGRAIPTLREGDER